MPATAVPYTKTNDSKRYEGKLTGSLRQGHTLQGSFIDNRVHRANEPVLSFSIDKAALISPSVPNRLGVVNYNAALNVSACSCRRRYSQKDWATEGVGGTSSNILDSPFLTRTGTQYQYNAPYFDASDPEQRNNRQLTASAHLLRIESAPRQPRAEGRLRELRRPARRRQRTELDRLRVPGRHPDGGRRAGSGCRRPSDSACSFRTSRACSAGFRIAARSSTRRRPRRTCRIAGSRPPNLTLNLGLRFEHAASDATTGQTVARARAHRAAPRRRVRRQRQRRYGAAGHVLAVLGQVQRRAVLAQHERRQLGPLHDGVRRAGRRRTLVRARLRCQQLRRCGRGHVPGLERAVRRRPVVAAHDRVHARRGAHVRRPQLREGGLRAAQDVELHRRVHRVRQRPDARSSSTARCSGSSTTSCTTTATR